MKITLRADEATGVHTRFTVFLNGANCGQLCARDEEAVALYMIIENGKHPQLDQFIGKGHWSKPEETS